MAWVTSRTSLCELAKDISEHELARGFLASFPDIFTFKAVLVLLRYDPVMNEATQRLSSSAAFLKKLYIL